ncbi:MAG: hypothetical protein M0P49_01465 [Bacilli bacterium]|nr:hypothetical protein [Bacilli bacterium]
MAGRPKKVVEEKSTPLSPINLEKENKTLRSELDELKQMVLNLTQNQQITPVVESTNINSNTDEDDSDIRPNKYIKVMSLNFGKLVLSTESKGQGKVFVFNKFGDVKNIVYSELANLIHHQQSFAEQGRFYVFDKQVVKNHGLVEHYEKFMNKEMIDNILNHNREEIIALFNNTTKTQRDIIVNLLIKKIVNGEDVDITKVDIISRLAEVNIYDIARDKIEMKNIE